jgi:hypothetical protein
MSRLRESPVRFVVAAQHAERSMAVQPGDGYRRIMSAHVMCRSAFAGKALRAIAEAGRTTFLTLFTAVVKQLVECPRVKQTCRVRRTLIS